MRLLFFAALMTGLLAYAQAPDNSKANKRDRDGTTQTADGQNTGSKADTEMARQIRKSIYADKSLSTYAHNVKILVRDGKVTLRGPVRTGAERELVEQKAAMVAGAGNVNNQLEVASPDNS